MTIEEQRAGVIDHALHFQIVQARAKTWAFPAQRTDGNTDHPDAIPEGALFRFPAELNLDAIDMDPYARMVATAIQKYGMYVSDRAGAVTLRGENPGNRYAADPYFGTNGILKCPGNFTMRDAPEACYPNSEGRLRGIPWDKLQGLKVNARTWK
jgi:hypothetical protein